MMRITVTIGDKPIGAGLHPIKAIKERIMRTTQQLSIALPIEMAEALKSKGSQL